MKDNKVQTLVPDLSRYIKTPTSGTLYLKTRGHWRFNQYENPDEPSFKDRSGNNLQLYTATGSVGASGTYSPVLSTFAGTNNSTFNPNATGLPFGMAFVGASGMDKRSGRQSVFTTADVGNGQRALVPFVNQWLDLTKLCKEQRKFIASERYQASSVDPMGDVGASAASTRETTYMIRFQYQDVPSTGNAIFTIGDAASAKTVLSVETIQNSYDLNILYTKIDGSSNTTTVNAVVDMERIAGTFISYWRTVWYTLFFSIKPNGIYNIRAYVGSDARHTSPANHYPHQAQQAGRCANVINNSLTTLFRPTISPTLYLGYGDPTPNIAFDASDFVSDINLLEFCVFDGTFGTDIQQAIVEASRGLPPTGWAYPAGDKFSYEFFGQPNRMWQWGTDKGGVYRSGLNNMPVRRAQRAFDSVRTLPRINVSGDPASRVNSGSINPFDDCDVMNFNTQDVMYPEMLPASWFSGSNSIDVNSDLTAGSPNDRRWYEDTHKTPFSRRLVVNQTLPAGVQDKTSLLLNKGLGASTQGGDKLIDSAEVMRSLTNTTLDSAYGGIIRPFNDQAPPHDAFYLNKSGTLDGVLPGFDSKLGDKVTIVIPLDVSSDKETYAGTLRSDDYYGVDPFGSGSSQPIMYYNKNAKSWVPAKYDKKWTSFRGWGGEKKMSTTGQVEAFNAVPLGFQGTTGFSIFPSASDPLAHIPSRGAFTDFYGFPYADKYEPSSDGCYIEMADYITEPFVLEATLFEVYGEVIDAGDDCLGLRGGDLRMMPYTGSYQGVPTGLVGEGDFGFPGDIAGSSTQDATEQTPFYAQRQNNGTNIIFGRGGVIGGGDLVNSAADFRRYIWSWDAVDPNLLIPLAIPHNDPSVRSYVTGSRYYTGNQSLIPGPGITIVTVTGSQTDTGTGDAAAGGWIGTKMNLFTGQGSNQEDVSENNSDKEIMRTHAHPLQTQAKNTTVTASAAPFWRCDTFFILRDRVGTVSADQSSALCKPFFTTYNPGAQGPSTGITADYRPYSAIGSRASPPLIRTPYNSQIPPGVWITSSKGEYIQQSMLLNGAAFQAAGAYGLAAMPSAQMDFSKSANSNNATQLANYHGEIRKIDSSFPFHIDLATTWNPIAGVDAYNADYPSVATSLTASSGRTRELVTYSQMVHYGYVSASTQAQMMIDGPFKGQTVTIGPQLTPTEKFSNTYINFQKGPGGINNPNLIYTSSGLLALPRLVSHPDIIVKEPTAGISFIKSEIFSASNGYHPASHWDYSLYGSFESGSHTGFFPIPGIPQTKLLNQNWPALPTSFTQTSIKSKNWLEVGLGKDLNINISKGTQHTQGLFTGSLVPVTGTLTNWQIVNDRGGASTKPAQSIIPQGCAASETKDTTLSNGIYRIFAPCRTPIADAGSGVGAVVFFDDRRANTSYTSTAGFWSQKSGTGRGVPPEMTSTRGLAAQVPGADLTPGTIAGDVMPLWNPILGGMVAPAFNVLTASVMTGSNNFYTINNIENTLSAPFTTVQKYSESSPYVLLPEDRIIVGFQCAMAGGNPANPQSLNVAPGPFTIPCSIDVAPGRTAIPYSASMTPGGPLIDLTTGGPWAQEQLYRNRNTTRHSYFDHRFKFKTGQSRLILYGSLVRNNKEKMPVLNQSLGSDSVREALTDGAVLDQFDMATKSELTGSYLSNYMEGAPSLLPNYKDFTSGSGVPNGSSWVWSNDLGQKVERWSPGAQSGQPPGRLQPRGVKQLQSSYGISGSFQRNVTLIDRSEVWYDSLMPNMKEIWEADGVVGFPQVGLLGLAMNSYSGNLTATSRGVFGVAGSQWGLNTENLILGQLSGPHEGTFNSSSAEPGRASAVIRTGTDVRLKAVRKHGLHNHAWASAFPFEQRYHTVSRLLADNGGLGLVTGSYSKQLSVPLVVEWSKASGVPGTPYPEKYGTEAETNPIMFVSTVNTIGGIGGDIAMQNQLNSGGKQAPSERATRAFLMGYGKTNRKHLDLMRSEWGYPLQSMLNLGTGNGAAIPGSAWFRWGHFEHPAGVKYGLANYDTLRSKAVFRGDRYGQFRDMLEPRLSTRFFEEGDESNERGLTDPLVNIIFVDSDGEPISDSTNTTCFNLSTAATSSKPYIEGDTASRNIIFTSRFVAVDWSAADTTKFKLSSRSTRR